MFTGLNEILFPAQPLAEPNVNTEDIDGKQTMENMSLRAVALPSSIPLTPFYGSYMIPHTHTSLCGDGIL